MYYVLLMILIFILLVSENYFLVIYLMNKIFKLREIYVKILLIK